MKRMRLILRYLAAALLLVGPAIQGMSRPLAEARNDDDPSGSAPRKLRPGFELCLGGGAAHRFFPENSQMFRSLTPPGYSSFTEWGHVGLNYKGEPDLSLSLTGFITPALGIRVQADVLAKWKIHQGSASTYDADWTYSFTPMPTPGLHSLGWGADGDFSSTVLSLDLVYRFVFSSGLDVTLYGGPSYLTGTVNLHTSSALFWVWPSGADTGSGVVPMPISLSQKISGLGFNAGAGIDVLIAKGLKLGIEIAGYVGPSATGNWTLTPGSYATAFAPSVPDVTLTQAMIETLNYSSIMSGFKIPLSFFSTAVCLKIGL